MSTLEERALADSDDSDRFADTLTSFIKTSGELVKVTAERDAALVALARVRALHFRGFISANRCGHCGFTWPCPTITALTEPTPEGKP